MVVFARRVCIAVEGLVHSRLKVSSKRNPTFVLQGQVRQEHDTLFRHWSMQQPWHPSHNQLCQNPALGLRRISRSQMIVVTDEGAHFYCSDSISPDQDVSQQQQRHPSGLCTPGCPPGAPEGTKRLSLRPVRCAGAPAIQHMITDTSRTLSALSSLMHRLGCGFQGQS